MFELALELVNLGKGVEQPLGLVVNDFLRPIELLLRLLALLHNALDVNLLSYRVESVSKAPGNQTRDEAKGQGAQTNLTFHRRPNMRDDGMLGKLN